MKRSESTQYRKELHSGWSVRVLTSGLYTKQVPEDCRTFKYEGSISSETLLLSERATVDEVNKILPFLSNKNFGKIVRYMIVLSRSPDLSNLKNVLQ